MIEVVAATGDVKSGPSSGWSFMLVTRVRMTPRSIACAAASGSSASKFPILARNDGEVVDGHLRLKAARKLGSWPGGDTTGIPVLCDEWTLDGATRGFCARALGFVVAFGSWAVAVAWAVSCVSVVDVVICFLLAVDYRVTTWITLLAHTSKAILRFCREGDGMAMVGPANDRR